MLLLALSVCAVVASSGTLVDQVVAVVDKEVITESELMAQARIELVFLGCCTAESTPAECSRNANAAREDLDPQLVESLRKYVIDQVLIANHVRRLGTIRVEQEALDERMRRFAAGFASQQAYEAFKRRFDIPEDVVREVVHRELRNLKYIEYRRRSWGLSDTGAGDPGKEELQRFVEGLRSSAEIRLLGEDGELELQ